MRQEDSVMVIGRIRSNATWLDDKRYSFTPKKLDLCESLMLDIDLKITQLIDFLCYEEVDDEQSTD